MYLYRVFSLVLILPLPSLPFPFCPSPCLLYLYLAPLFPLFSSSPHIVHFFLYFHNINRTIVLTLASKIKMFNQGHTLGSVSVCFRRLLYYCACYRRMKGFVGISFQMCQPVFESKKGVAPAKAFG